MDNTIYLQNLAAFNKVLNEKGFMSQSATYMIESLPWSFVLAPVDIKNTVLEFIEEEKEDGVVLEPIKPAPPSA